MKALTVLLMVAVALVFMTTAAYAREVEFEDASAALYLPVLIDSQPAEQAQLSADALESFVAAY